MTALIVEWVSFGGALISVWLYGYKTILGPITGILTSISFIVFGLMVDLPAAVITNIIFIILHFKNIKKYST